jgi:hypothetical protein
LAALGGLSPRSTGRGASVAAVLLLGGWVCIGVVLMRGSRYDRRG